MFFLNIFTVTNTSDHISASCILNYKVLIIKYTHYKGTQ